MNSKKSFLGTLSLFVLMLQSGIAEATVAGQVQFVYGGVTLTELSGESHTLRKGDAVNEGDTVSTARNASAQIKMKDGGFIAVRPDTQLKFDEFKFSGKAGQPERGVFSLFRGGFRAVTGLIGRINKSDYKIRTPAATIGIRGTDHETVYLPAGIQGADAGAYSKVNVGETTLTTDKGTISVLPNQMGFAGGLDQAPQIQPINTQLYTVSATPTKTIKSDKSEKEQSEKPAKESNKATGADEKSERKAAKPEPASQAGEGGQSSSENEQQTGQAKQNAPEPVSTRDTREANNGEANSNPSSSNLQDSPTGQSLRDGNLAPSAIRDSAVVDNTQLPSNIGTSMPAVVAQPESTSRPPTGLLPSASTVLPVTLSNGGQQLDTTSQTLTAGGEKVSIQNGVYATQAKTAADAALVAATATQLETAAAVTAKNSLAAIAPVSVAPATSAISAATTAKTSADTAVNSAAGLTARAVPNVTSFSTMASTVDAQAVTAQAAFTANGTLADVVAATANTTIQASNAAVQSAKNSAQTSAASIVTNNTALASAQAAASAALTAATTDLSSATNKVNSVGTQNTAIAAAQTLASTQLNIAQAADAAAQAAATAAQAAATLATTLQVDGDLTGAQAQLAIAQQQLIIAQTKQKEAIDARTLINTQLSEAQAAALVANTSVSEAVTAANNAAAAATTAQTQAAAANTAVAAASAEVTTISTQLAVLNNNAAVVATNAPIAAYHNPALGNYARQFLTPYAVTGGYQLLGSANALLVSNTDITLDGSGHVVKFRNNAVDYVNGATPMAIANAQLAWTGGVAADQYQAADGSITFGRWQGGTLDVVDQATTGAFAPFAISLAQSGAMVGPTSSVWAYAISPVNGYVQTLTGTSSYTKTANTTPFDTQGGMGVLNSASLSADFANQSVNAALNITMNTGTYAGGVFSLSASNLPISQQSFSTSTNNPSVIACMVGPCTGRFAGDIKGGFTGATSSGVLLGYGFGAVGATNLSDVVAGYVAFDTATAPSVATAAAPTASSDIAVSLSSQSGYGFTQNWNNSFTTLPSNVVTALPSPSFAFSWGGSNSGNSTALVGATGAINGSATSSASTGIQFGRYASISSITQGYSNTFGGINNGNQSGRWAYGETGYLDTPTSLSAATGAGITGTFAYVLDGVQTAPTDWNGQVGTLNSLTLTADFANSTISSALSATMGATIWNATASGLPLSGANFYLNGGAAAAANASSSITMGATGTESCPSCSFSINGGFTGQNYAGAVLAYHLYDNATGTGNGVTGVAAMTRAGVATNPTVANAAPVTPLTYLVATAGTNMGTDVQNASTVTVDANNVLTSYGSTATVANGGYAFSNTVVCATCSGRLASTGIRLGTWDVGSSTYASTNPAADTQFHWITGPAVPEFFVESLLGTAAYSFDGGTTPTSQTLSGTLNPVVTGAVSNASLVADFNKQAVAINFTVVADGHTWVVSTPAANAAPLASNNGNTTSEFKASNLATGSGALSITLDGVAVSNTTGSYVSGQLTGTLLNGAVMQYALTSSQTDAVTSVTNTVSVNGVAAFNQTAVNGVAGAGLTIPASRLVILTLADPVKGMQMNGGANNASRVVIDTQTNGVTGLDMGNNNNGNQYANSASSSIAIDTAVTQMNVATDPVSGISWGRWSGGNLTMTDRVTGIVTSKANTNAHWIAGPTMVGQVVLPTTGTFNYVHAGGTQPSDSLGNVGTVNSATLQANFTAQTVNLGVDATVNATSYIVNGSNLPIQPGSTFGFANGGTVTASINGVTTTNATIGGAFTGANGNGAAVVYGFQNGTTSMSGVAAFHR
ncbi:MAG: FecR domain-containing protein [Sideroxydans sp.]|nr:FecR domain-containing protein [Sideroxydans sp.]